MGSDVKLKVQLPVQAITSKHYNESKPIRQSELQYLRLLHIGGYQFLLFFCNVTSKKYRECKCQQSSQTQA